MRLPETLVTLVIVCCWINMWSLNMWCWDWGSLVYHVLLRIYMWNLVPVCLDAMFELVPCMLWIMAFVMVIAGWLVPSRGWILGPCVVNYMLNASCTLRHSMTLNLVRKLLEIHWCIMLGYLGTTRWYPWTEWLGYPWTTRDGILEPSVGYLGTTGWYPWTECYGILEPRAWYLRTECLVSLNHKRWYLGTGTWYPAGVSRTTGECQLGCVCQSVPTCFHSVD